MRIGLGYDIHKLVENRKLILGGVEIPNEFGLLGHSDADVLVHAIIDAIFGSIAQGDIGSHFPDNDLKYKDVNSMNLLKKANEILINEGYEIINIDTNIICQKPKLAPYINEMRNSIAKCLSIPIENISIKAKTNENLEAVGNLEAIKANCIVLIEKIKLA